MRILNSKVVINTSDIIISRNRIYIHNNSNYTTFYGITIASSCSNLLFENNWIYINGYATYTHNHGIYSSGTDLTNLIIRNNYIYVRYTYYAGYQIYLSGTVLADNVTIYQNIFSSNTNNTYLNAKETQFYNNIMIAGNFQPNGSYYNNNIGNGTQFGTTNGNQENVDMSIVFVDVSTGIDSDLQLASRSPAIGAGMFGEDCGMYGMAIQQLLPTCRKIPM